MKPSAKKIVHSITAFTLLDYPDQTACILWFAGCNMKCSYCYNPEIVFGKGSYSIPEIISFLEKRRGLLDAVVFSGGECLLHKETIDAMQCGSKNVICTPEQSTTALVALHSKARYFSA